MSIVVMGAVFVDIKGYPLSSYLPGGRNAGRVVQVHGGVSRYEKFEWFYEEVLGKTITAQESEEPPPGSAAVRRRPAPVRSAPVPRSSHRRRVRSARCRRCPRRNRGGRAH